jgi:N-acetylmuramoyl-L-alanine amidase
VASDRPGSASNGDGALSVPDADLPTGKGEHVIGVGECITSIADSAGHFWEKIWNDSANEDLRLKREHPNLLLPGDRVTIPEKTRREESKSTGQSHRFRRKGVPALLRLRFTAFGQPREGEKFEVHVEGAPVEEGELDDDGQLRVPIPPAATRAEVFIGEARKRLVFQLGGLPPANTVLGMQHRLNNLNYPCGEPDGTLNDETVRAMQQFQARNLLPTTDEPDDDTYGVIADVHGC